MTIAMVRTPPDVAGARAPGQSPSRVLNGIEGHFLPEEQPELVIEQLRKFLAAE
jgi:hypothetical protein